MNKLYRIFVLLFLTVIFLISCSNKEPEEKNAVNDTTKTLKSDIIATNDSIEKSKPDTLVNSEKKKKEVKIYKYICPLGCKKGNSDTEGLCPDCGMELIENPDYITEK